MLRTQKRIIRMRGTYLTFRRLPSASRGGGPAYTRATLTPGDLHGSTDLRGAARNARRRVGVARAGAVEMARPARPGAIQRPAAATRRAGAEHPVAAISLQIARRRHVADGVRPLHYALGRGARRFGRTRAEDRRS